MSQSRQLAAIVFTDIVGYTALMERDEKRAFEVLKKNLDIHQSVISEFNGRLIKELGDGILASFSTVSDALKASINIQQQCKEVNEFELSIGIHQGEVVFEDGDVFGDAVNVASRIQSLGISGSILFSKKIADEIKNKIEFHATSIGSFEFKNVTESIEVFALTNEGFPVPRKSSMQGKLKKKYNYRNETIAMAIILFIISGVFVYREFFFKMGTEATGKSIAVLPFTDMSPGKDQEYFSDGLSEELINSLAKIPSLKVAGRTSSFSYKGINKNLKAIGEELGVETILVGSLRKSGNQLRITAQLINSNDGFHLWTETFDIELTDVFVVQDKITAAIVSALNIHLLNNTVLEPTPTTNPESYTIYLKARQNLARRGEGLLAAKELFEEAIALDPNFGPAYSGLAKTLAILPVYIHLGSNSSEDMNYVTYNELAKEAATNALELNPNSAEAYFVLGYLAMNYDWDFELAKICFQKSVDIAPNNAEVYNFFGDFYLVTRNRDRCIEMETKAIEMDPLLLINYQNLFRAYVLFGEYENAIKVSEKSSLNFNTPVYSYEMLNLFILQNELDSAIELGKKFEAGADDVVGRKKRAAIEIAIATGNRTEAENLIEVYSRTGSPAISAEFYLKLKMWEKAAEWIEKAYQVHDPLLVYWLSITLPEDYEDHPDLRKAFDKPELNKLFEIRRENLAK